MATYLLINLIFLFAILIAFRIQLRKPSNQAVIVLIALLLLTAVFDSLIIGFGIVGYNPDLILGVYLGNAPIEDFFYSVLAVILVPTLWNLMERKSNV